jgi:iron(III) transport system permease protein
LQKHLTLAGAAALLAVIGLVPIVAMIGTSFHGEDGFSLKAYQSLVASGKQQSLLMGRSLLLSLLTSALTVLVGVPLGVLLGKTDLPLRKTLAVLFTMPLLIPPYVTAVAWFTVLGKGGWIGHALPAAKSELLSWALFGLSGCTWVLCSAFMPIVMLLTMTYLGTINPRWEEAGRLVSPWPTVLRRITVPLMAPAILFAAVLVFLLTLGEVGTPTFLRYPVYPIETLTQFAAFYDFGAATAAAIPMLLVTLAILVLEYSLLHKRLLGLRAMTPGRRQAQIELGSWRLPLFAIALAWAFVTVLLPLMVLLVQASSLSAFGEAFSRASDSMVRSLVFAVIGATFLSVLGFFCGYLIYDRTLPLWRSVDALTLFLFTLPGTVIGIGLISLWNRPLTNAIYGTPAIIILGYVAQYAVLSTRITSATLERIPRSLEQAARLCGASWAMTLGEIVAPLAKRGLITAWLIGYVFCLRDLGISMVVYPPGLDTLPIRILTLMANGAPSLIAALCIVLIAVTLLPLGLVSLWLQFVTRNA